jgi:hexosaminidase
LFVPWKFHPRNSNFEPSTNNKKYISSVLLTQTGSDPKNLPTALAGDVDESYSLTVKESGEVAISAKTSIGLVRGLATFSQLFFKHSQGGVYTNLAPVTVQDSPKFVWRGINMDVSRNYYPIEKIKQMIDAMAFNKFNRFHIHATDAQSWPLEIPSIPQLTAKGAYAASLVYTVAAQREIQTYGALQGVDVHFEIDMPGHTSSIAFSFPELITAFNVQPNWDTYCAEPPCGSLKLNSPAVGSFLEKLWADLLPRVKPFTAYFHTGGDEVNANAYNLDDTVKSNDSAVLIPLLQKLVDFNHQKIRAAGLTPIVWEEMLLQWNLTLGTDVVVQTWQSDDAVAQTVAKGHKALVGNYNYWVSGISRHTSVNTLRTAASYAVCAVARACLLHLSFPCTSHRPTFFCPLHVSYS